MFSDSLQGKLVLGFSNVNKICNVPFRGIISYDGLSFKDLDVGVQTHMSGSPGAACAQICIPYNNKSLYGGFFQSVGSNTLFSTGLALWNGTVWDTFPKKAFKYNSNNSPAIPTLFKDNDNLFIGGVFDTIAGTPAKNFCYFNGVNFIPLNMSNKINVGVRKITKYKNEFYLSGLFINSPASTYSKIIRYNSGQAFDVGNGIMGSLASVQDMLVYNDTLYVAGAFAKADGNLGNHIMKWDGSQFYDAGFGNFYDWGGISKLINFKNRLYAFGRYIYCADKKAYGAAFYEKGRWTVNKDSLNFGIIGAEVLKDTIYVAGGFPSINGDTTLKYFVKLKCPDFDGCIKNDNPIQNSDFSIFPNPFNDKITVNTNNSDPTALKKIILINMLGQIVYQLEYYQNNIIIDLPQLFGSTYIAELYLNNTFNFRTKLIKR